MASRRGDITPHTPLGRIVASVLILIGYSVIAIPTGLITTHMSSAFQKRHWQRKCPQCQQSQHEHSAQYCNRCGSNYRINQACRRAQSDAIRPEPLIRAREYGTACGPFPGTAERGQKCR